MVGQPDNTNLQRIIDGNESGMRLDRLIAGWRGLSRAAVLRLLDAGLILYDGKVMGRSDKGLVVASGAVVVLDPRGAEGETIKPDTTLAIEVLAMGAGWIAVNKPAGVPVRPHDLNETGTVLNALVADDPQINGVGEGGLRSGVVHRLDNDTSGVLVIATQPSAWQRLRQDFSEHEIEKRYTALVHGSPKEQGALTLPLRVAQHSPARVAVCEDNEKVSDARACSLAWRVIERLGPSASLVDVDLHTGFLHQVRAMMAHLGWPVIGDRVYGKASTQIDAPRQMLHASSLRIEDQLIAAPLPGDMRQVMKALRDG